MLLSGTRPWGEGAAEWYQAMAGVGVPGVRTGKPRGGGCGVRGHAGKGRIGLRGKHRSGGRLWRAGSRGSDVTAPPAPTPSPSQPLTGGSMSLRRADAAPSAGASGAVGGAAFHWLRRSGLGRATAPPRGRGRNSYRDTSGRDPKHGAGWKRCSRPSPGCTKARGGGGVWFISSPFILFPQKYLGGGSFCTESRHSAARGVTTGLTEHSRHAHRHNGQREGAGIALTAVNFSWGAAGPRVQPRPGTYLQREGRRGHTRQRWARGAHPVTPVHASRSVWR